MTVTTPTPDDHAAKILQEASDVIESEQANIQIEIEFSKAIRVGILLKSWNQMMQDGEGKFTQEWAESAAMTIFHQFFPPPPQYYTDERDDDYDDDDR